MGSTVSHPVGSADSSFVERRTASVDRSGFERRQFTEVLESGVAVRKGETVTSALSSTDVSFRDIDPDEARRYWHSGEPQDKAGAYAIQGRGGAFVRAIMGSYSGVVGLPIFETAELLRKAGIDPLAEIQS